MFTPYATILQDGPHHVHDEIAQIMNMIFV